MLPDITLPRPVGPEDAPVLVLAHSLGTGPVVWEQALAGLRDQFRITHLTLPGHDGTADAAGGFSLHELADGVAAAIRQHADQVFFGGLSFGGALGLMLALRHAELVRAAAVISGAASFGDRQIWRVRAGTVRAQSTAVLMLGAARTWFADPAEESETEPHGRVLRSLRSTSAEGYAMCADALQSYDLRSQLSAMRLPVLSMHGADDQLIQAADVDVLSTTLPEAHAVMLPRGGHQLTVDEPAAVTRAMTAFFSGTGR